MNKCNQCTRRITTTAVTVSGGALLAQTGYTQPLEECTRYCIIIAQPIPVGGYNLPVSVVVDGVNVPLRHFGIGQIEYGADIPPRGRVRIPAAYNNAGEFCDLRKRKHGYQEGCC